MYLKKYIDKYFAIKMICSVSGISIRLLDKLNQFSQPNCWRTTYIHIAIR